MRKAETIDSGRDRLIDRPAASWYGARALRRRNGFPHGVRNRPTGALGLGAAMSLLALAGVFFSACGPVEYINQVGVKAASAVSAAKLAQADRYAPYEYTAAEEYLHKAREEAGYAEFEDAIEFGRRAEDFANKGRAIAVARLSQSASVSSTVTPASESEAPKEATPEAPKAEGAATDSETPGEPKVEAPPESKKSSSRKKPGSKAGNTGSTGSAGSTGSKADAATGAAE